MKTALLFSGQGSQYIGMLKDTYSDFDKAAQLIDSANEILGRDLKSICFDGPEEELKLTKNTQPAIFLHSAVNFSLIENKLDFNAVAGHSVGEYAALYAAGVLKFEDAISLVARRGELMYEAGEVKPGTMLAVIGLNDEKLLEVCSNLTDSNAGEYAVAANFNSPGQIVVSGSRGLLRENLGIFKEAGAKIVKELNVSGAFHSPLMEPAKIELEKAIEKTEFSNARIPIYVNVYGRPLVSSDEIKQALVKQLTSPVLWTQTMNNMFGDGFGKFIELGPGNVLQGLVKRTLKGVEFLGYDNSNDLKNLLNL